MEFVEASGFSALVSKYLTDDAFRELQNALGRDPEAGDLIPGAGGFRKVRWAEERRQRGKRGGLRIIYAYFRENEQVWLASLYAKGDVADLAADEKKALKAAMETEKLARARKR